MRGDTNFRISCPIIITADEVNACPSGAVLMELIEVRAKVAQKTVAILVDQYLEKRRARSHG